MRYSQHVTETPQSEPLEGQVANSAGGFSFQVDDWVRLDRFLILGSEGGSYYASERKLTRDNAQAVNRCWQLDPQRTARQISEISHSGRAPKNDPAVFALALGASHTSPDARKCALEQLNTVCRIGTHLFQFVDAVDSMRGWGRGLRDSVAGWYAAQDPDKLALQLTKYRQRGGWAHRDVLRMCHLTPGNLQPAIRWAVTGKLDDQAPQLIHAWSKAQEPNADLEPLLEHGLTWEMIPTERLGDPKTWRLLVPKLPMTALLRNLARMTASGAVQAMSVDSLAISSRIISQEALTKARIHPIAVLAALYTYAGGHGLRGSLTWMPIKEIVEALDQAFLLSFGNVQPSGKRLRVALDVSGSMDGGEVAGIPGLTPRTASGALALVWAKTEPLVEFQGFSDKLIDISLTRCESVREVCQKLARIPMGGTDCSLPMLDAIQGKVERDAFIVLTDSETWAGREHPPNALRRYRKIVPTAKLCVVGMVSNEFSIADPNDAGMMDVVGFDTATPNLIRDFVS